ncbi:hypothetical protein [Megasphaera elsdenii]|uniref:hypothetical protein n=1 Tax=Megasphaera elsdenii TaxID=907 RepID=UPI00242FDF37|nr:hypothetical protein [Megasphaera elsdenii]
MHILMRKSIEDKIRNAAKRHYSYARINKTGDTSVDDAMCQTIEEWGYKVAQNKTFIMVLL